MEISSSCNTYPPWLFKGEAYILNYWLNPQLLKVTTPFQLSFSRFGRMVQVLIVRYHDTPFGPYDEMFMIDHPLISKRCVSCIPKILVSQPESIALSKRYWGIDKKLAGFEWQETAKTSTCIVTYQHQQMHIELKKTRQARSFYINSSHIPKSMLKIAQFFNGNLFQFIPQFRGHIQKIHNAAWQNHQAVFPDFSRARYLQSFYSPNFQLLLPEAQVQTADSMLLQIKHP